MDASLPQQNNRQGTGATITRWAMRETMGLVMIALILFIASGDWTWWQGWGVVAITALWVIATGAGVIPRNPELLGERRGPRKGAKTWDVAIMGVVGAATLAIYLVAGLDRREGWSTAPDPMANVAGMIIMAAGYGMVAWATTINAYFSSFVRVQAERGHQVVTDGPYRAVRHPGYAGSIAAFAAQPIALGSWWALIPAGLIVVLMIARTALEDRTLRAELPGYAEYSARTRYRLIPGLW